MRRERATIQDFHWGTFDYIGCNCRGDLGPHVVFGGTCMVTPTRGTRVFEMVTAGKAELTTNDES